MPEVATADAQESPEQDAPEADATTTPASDELTTLQKRLSGTHKALTESQNRAKAAEAEREELRQKVLQYEQANLSETEKMQRRMQELEQEAATAKAVATRAVLSKQFPLASEVLGDDIPADEERLSAIEARLRAALAAADAEEPEPRIEPNRPRRGSAPATRTLADSKAALAEAFAQEFPNYGADGF